MPTELDLIRTRQAEIQADIDALESKEDVEESDGTRADALLAEFTELEGKAEPLQARATAIAAMRETIRNERASRETGSDQHHLSDQGKNGPQFRQKIEDPWGERDAMRLGIMPDAQVRARAAEVIDRAAHRADNFGLEDPEAQEVFRKLEKGGKLFGTAFARQILATSSPEYLEAFQSYLSDPSGYQSRAALSLTPANGGYLVPFTLDPTIILTNNGSANPYRRVATVKTTTTNDWNGVTSAGVTAEWTAEGTEAADATPTVGQLKITPQKADAYLFGSFEVLGDSDFAAQLPGLLADAKDRLEENAFAVGTGTGQPRGAVTAASTIAGASGTAASGPTAASVYTLMGALAARWRGPRSNVRFMGALPTINVLRNVPKFTGSTQSIVNDDNPNGPAMLGTSFEESTSIVSALANGNKVLLYGDMSQYYIVDRVGMSIVYDPVVLGTNRRPTGQGAWYAFWRVGADVSTSNALKVLTLTT